MCKREHESFKEYAQRWKDLAAQVAPPMMEREIITMIEDTLPVFYYKKISIARLCCDHSTHMAKLPTNPSQPHVPISPAPI